MRNRPGSAVIASLALLVAAQCAAAEIKFEIIDSARNIQGTTLPPGTRIEYTEAGKINYAILEKPAAVQDLPCQGWIYFYESGKVRDAELSRDVSLQGITLSKGSRIYLYESGRLRSGTLAEAKMIGGVKVADGARVSLFETGKLVNVYLTKAQEIQGILCAPGPVDFYNDGRLKSSTLAGTTEIGRIRYPAGSVIDFYPSGRVNRAALSEPVKIEGNLYGKGVRVNLGEDGKILPVR
ncbi:MAG: hypothetical protein WC481_03130 [Candidatus Omnitrophota bacterium]